MNISFKQLNTLALRNHQAIVRVGDRKFEGTGVSNAGALLMALANLELVQTKRNALLRAWQTANGGGSSFNFICMFGEHAWYYPEQYWFNEKTCRVEVRNGQG